MTQKPIFTRRRNRDRRRKVASILAAVAAVSSVSYVAGQSVAESAAAAAVSEAIYGGRIAAAEVNGHCRVVPAGAEPGEIKLSEVIRHPLP